MIAMAAFCLLGFVVLSLAAVLFADGEADKLLAALLASGLGMALLAVSALWLAQPALLDVALLMAALAVTLGSTYAKARRRDMLSGGRDDG